MDIKLRVTCEQVQEQAIKIPLDKEGKPLAPGKPIQANTEFDTVPIFQVQLTVSPNPADHKGIDWVSHPGGSLKLTRMRTPGPFTQGKTLTITIDG